MTGEALAVIAALEARTPAADAPRCHESDANGPDGQADGGNRPGGNGDDLPPVRWQLDDLDRRALLACGILPTPSVDDLPEPWKSGYRTHAARLVKLGVHREHAEAIALREVLARMLAAGELTREGW